MEDYRLLCYERDPWNDAGYDAKLSHSMHLALAKPDSAFQALNHNYGVLFPKGITQPDGAITAKTLIQPCLFQISETLFGIFAVQTGPAGENDLSSKGYLLGFTTTDFVHYQQVPALKVGNDLILEVRVDDQLAHQVYWREASGKCYAAKFWYDAAKQVFEVSGTVQHEVPAIPPKLALSDAEMAGIADCLPRSVIHISEAMGRYLRNKLNEPFNTANQLPQAVMVGNQAELEAVRATAQYSDGTTTEKRVDWYCRDVDFTQPQTVTVKGRIHQDHYIFPMALDRADPCIGHWNDRYYFIATNDADRNHSLYLREATMVPGLVTAQEVKILDSNMYPTVGNLLWAPEFHQINQQLFIFYSATVDRFEDVQSMVMALKPGGNPMLADDWLEPHRVVRPDGSPLFTQGLTLDMTEFTVAKHAYVAWSQRQMIPKDLGAWLYIAEVDSAKPWQLITDPVVIAKPVYSWENNRAPVNEGPFAIQRNGKVYLTYSGALIDDSYVVGLLSIDAQADLLQAKNWQKSNYPILTSNTVAGEFGPGHNAYVVDEDGHYWNSYHAHPGKDGPRSSGIRRVHFDCDGEPDLGLTESLDLDPQLVNVELTVTVVPK